MWQEGANCKEFDWSGWLDRKEVMGRLWAPSQVLPFKVDRKAVPHVLKGSSGVVCLCFLLLWESKMTGSLEVAGTQAHHDSLGR